jgi:hypothetical protein
MAIYQLLLTLDYELPAHRPPDVMQYIINPTEALLDVCGSFGAKLTIMVEIGELWAFENATNWCFAEYLGYDAAERIRSQLVQAIKQGHDVQLHLHPQWLNAKWEQGRWKVDYSKYRIPDLDYHELVNVFRCGKEYLENLLSCYCDDYSCIGFRSGNWITQPSGKYLRALHEAGLKSDTSVFKWAYVNTPSVFVDYRNASNNALPWVPPWDDINRSDPSGGILEVPIYAEPVSLFGMLTMKRLRSACNYFFVDRRIMHAVKASTPLTEGIRDGLSNKMAGFFRTHPKKLDFCKLTLREMLRMMENIRRRFDKDPIVTHVPIVMVGHSNEPMCDVDLRTFLDEISRRFGDSLEFATYRKVVQQYWLTNTSFSVR